MHSRPLFRQVDGSLIAGVGAYGSSGLGGAAATGDGDGDLGRDFCYVQCNFLCTNIGVDSLMHSQCNFYPTYQRRLSPAMTV